MRGDAGQSTVEWIGLVLVVSLLALGGAALAGANLPGAGLLRALAAKLACAAALGGECSAADDAELEAEYGAEMARTVRRRAPTLAYEEGMRALPVDFRSCRRDPCSMGSSEGEAHTSDEGEPVTLFTHVVDCRGRAESVAASGHECSGQRTGNLYLQYWAYYPGSSTLKALPGRAGYHHDDWESFQVRVGRSERLARASSHHGYNHRGGAGSWLSDAGVTARSGWGPDIGHYFISGGSHAGHAFESSGPLHRWTPARRIRLVPVEAVARGRHGATPFAVTPPWRKRVYRDPEHTGTD